MPLINCEINLDLIGLKIVLFRLQLEKQNFNNRYRLYVPFVTLSTEDSIKLLKQLEFGFKKTIDWNKYQSKEGNKKQSR